MKKFLFLLLLVCSTAYAGDEHQSGQGHAVTYQITDFSGNPVSGETPRVAVKRIQDGLYLDFSDGTFKVASSATTLFASMSFDQTNGVYMRVVTIDAATVLTSGDYAITVSNDSSTYGDTQTETVNWDNLNNLIKIYR